MTEADIPRVAELAGQLGYPSTPAEMAGRFQSVAARQDQVVLVATDDRAQVVGWVHVLTAAYIQSDSYAEIGGLVVDDTCRGQGIGQALVHAAECWAADRGLPQIRLRSNAVRERAHTFYQRLGYEVTKTSLQFSKRLDSQR